MYFTNVDSRERLHQLIDLVDTYFVMGGHHVQINCQDKEIFRDAQRYPEKYPTLIVRVSGYNANFIELPREVQDEIISRTSLCV
jgi:formate C-acetyltransferase